MNQTPPPNPPNPFIDAYLDGTISPSERAAFETLLTADPALARAVALQQRIDTRLRAEWSPPAHAPALVPSTLALAAAPAPLARPKPWHASPIIRIAALIAIVALPILAITRTPLGPVLFGPAPSDLAANIPFRELVRSGLKPAWVCENDQVFRDFTVKTFGVPMVMAPAPHVQVVGWTYTSGLLDSSASILMCRVDGQPSMLVVGRRENDRSMHADPGSSVRIHRTSRWGLVMYELNERADAPITALLNKTQ